MSEASAIPPTGGRLSKGAATAAAAAASFLMLGTVGALTPTVEKADASFGDTYDVADINDGSGPAQEVAAIPNGKAWWAGACDLSSPVTEEGVSPINPRHCIDWGVPNNQCPGGVFVGCSTDGPIKPDPWETPPSWRLAGISDAGSHPDGSATFAIRRDINAPLSKIGAPDGSPDNIKVELPAGFIGNPQAIRMCTALEFAENPPQCPPESQAGVANIALLQELDLVMDDGVFPIYNLEPRHGYTAEFGIPKVGGAAGFTSVRIIAQARTSSDFGVTAQVTQIPAALPLFQQAATIWGVPWAETHDPWRLKTGEDQDGGAGLIPDAGLSPADQASYDPAWGPIRPFLSNLTECSGQQPNTRLVVDTFQKPGTFLAPDGDPDLSNPNWLRFNAAAPAVTECDQPPFNPAAVFAPTSTAPDSASGLDVDITIPHNNDPPAGVATDPDDGSGAPAHWRSDSGRSTSHLDRTVVPLPDGFTVNPSGAAGLEGCSDAVMGVKSIGNPYTFTNVDPFDGVGADCPDGSKIGTVEATTPLLEGSPNLTGEFVLGTPRSTDPQSGEMLRTFLVLRNKDRNLVAKVFGSTVADPATGRLTATFDKNPRVPVENIKVSLKGGERGLFAQAPTCGTRTTDAVFTPWTAAHGGGGVAKTVSSPFTVAGDCSFGFAPGLESGMSTQQARSNGIFSFRFTRPQGDQTLRGLTAVLPRGLLASVKHVDLCTDAQAAAGSCPLGSQIGIVDAKAGSGDPFVLEQKGRVYLTEGYKGGEYGLAVKIRPIAGPFRGAMELSPIVVRQAIHVDRKTAQVTAISDPFPLIHHGVPLRVREVTVKVDRPGFMLNPSDCSPKQVQATILSAEGTRADVANRFQASNCADLRFKPRLNLRLTGRRQVRTGRHPGVRAVVRQQGIGEAGIEKAVVRLPKSLALDVDNAQALCEFADGTKPDLENHCPKGSIVGRARAKTPLLNDDLVGNVYFVKNVRIDKDTGNEIRTLPMIVVALRGEIAVNLVGESSTTRSGKLVNTFDEVPDAPVSRFNLNIKGGSNGILAVTRTRRSNINLCAKPRSHVAEADMDGQNGRRRDFNVRMKTQCRKRRQSAAKRRAVTKRKQAVANRGASRG